MRINNINRLNCIQNNCIINTLTFLLFLSVYVIPIPVFGPLRIICFIENVDYEICRKVSAFNRSLHISIFLFLITVIPCISILTILNILVVIKKGV